MPKTLPSSDKIILKGVRVNNLKNIDVEIPKNKFVVITGLSGSGKSSLAFDTLYAEGQRLYLESLSTYARQFANIQSKPDFDFVSGLSPAIAIDQKNISNNPRSTIATMTEIYDYLRLLMARVGKLYCPNCGSLVQKQSLEKILEKIIADYKNQKVFLLAPVMKNKKGLNKKIILNIQQANFFAARLNHKIYNLQELMGAEFETEKKYTLEIVVDELKIPDNFKQLKQFLTTPNNRNLYSGEEYAVLKKFSRAIDLALDLSNGLMTILNQKTNQEQTFSKHLSCPKCDFSSEEIEPRLFSFNSPFGACEFCRGLGIKEEFDPELVIPNKKLTLAEGALRPYVRLLAKNQNKFMIDLALAAEKNNFSLNTQIKNLSEKQMEILLYGDQDFEGVINNLNKRYLENDSEYFKNELNNYLRHSICSHCQGKRLNKMALLVKIANKNIAGLTDLNLKAAREFFKNLLNNKMKECLNNEEAMIANPILKEIVKRLNFLIAVGLEYLTLNRSAETLSGGEAQRIKLSTQISAGLTGVLYVLDEPSIGLHPKDNAKLIATLKKMRDLGNSIIVVEHDRETMLSADWLIDVGPGAGKFGGQIVATGKPTDIKNNPHSLTGAFLSKRKQIEKRKQDFSNKKISNKFLIIKKAEEFNLKKIDVKIPLGKLVCLTGVSGSGKSTLVTEILSKALSHHFYHTKDLPGKHEKIIGLENIDKVIAIDQTSIGRTPRSNPATYTGIFSLIRELFATTPEAKIKKYDVGNFSFNVVGGRCEACQGDGYKKVEMNFLPDVFIKCEECNGQRFKKEILEIHFQGKNIAEVLKMSVIEALDFFNHSPILKAKLQLLTKVGLDYLELGQSATTLSGGEAQRIKLATELMRRATGRTFYILDEPTTGLHFADIERLLNVLYRLVELGNTVLIVEHNLDVIKNADWVIDLGPEGGDKGGYIVTEGTPEQVAKNSKSWTGKYLRRVLK